MAPLKVMAMRAMFMELRKICQHPYLSAPELENLQAPEEEQHRQLVGGSGKLAFLKILLPRLKERGHRVLLFSQFKIALDLIEDFLYGEGYKYLRLDGDVQQAKRQKSMDAFNAPGSDYFIFLLTTRAGGVGINLATADTVIVHDPDFNPHQDQQAIARAHRYGQKKPVMVFKLMTKNSIEEKIIEKTKKKLVLDHLIVQNLHRENEDGDIDDMIMHGAKALYEADAEGRAESDINYTSKMVDDLIDKVEREAQDEMLAVVARDRAKEEAAAVSAAGGEGEAEGSGAAAQKHKDVMSFEFAKIWEVGRNELAEVDTNAEVNDEEVAKEQEEAWEKLLQSAKEAEQRRLAEEDAARAAKRLQRHNLHYQNDGVLSDESPARKKKGKGKGKKDSKSAEMVDSDGDFAPVIDATADSDSDGMVSGGDAELLQDQNGNLITVPGKQRFTEEELAEWKAAREASRAAARGHVVAPTASNLANGSAPQVPPPNENAIAGPSRIRKAKETPEEKEARKAARKEEKRKLKEEAQREAQRAKISKAVPSVLTQPSGLILARSAAGEAHNARILNAQNVLQWLYQTFSEVGFEQAKQQWATLGVVEYTPDVRKQTYRYLASLADDIFKRMGQPPYFATPDTSAKVFYLIEQGAPIIPDRLGAIPPIPFDPPAPDAEAVPPLATQEVVSHLEAAPAPLEVPSSLPLPTAFPSDPPPASLSAASADKGAQRKDEDKDKRCPLCNSAHGFLDCPRRMPFDELLKYQRQLKGSKEDPEDIASPSSTFTPSNSSSSTPLRGQWQEFDANAEQEQAIGRLNDILRLYRKHGSPETSERASAVLGHGAPSQFRAARAAAAAAAEVNGHASSSSKRNADALVRDEVPPPAKKTRIDLSSGVSTFTSSQPIATSPATPLRNIAPAPAPMAKRTPSKTSISTSPLAPTHVNGTTHVPLPVPTKSPGRGRKAAEGCTICGGAKFHPAVECPVVKAGPESIARALHQFQKGDAQYDVLKHLYHKAKRCAFCGKACNRSVRECAEAIHGAKGRKALKDLIRQVDVDNHKESDPVAKAKLDARLAKLYEAYQSWPK